MVGTLRQRRAKNLAQVFRRYLLNRRSRGQETKRQLASLTREVRQHQEIGYTDKSIALVGVTTSGSYSPSMAVPARGDNFRANRQGNVIYITKQQFQITVVGSEDTAGITSDVYNLVGIKIGYIAKNNASSTFPTITGGAGSLWDNGLMTDNAVLPLLPHGPDIVNVKIQRKYVKKVSGVDTATAGSSGQTYVGDHVKFLQVEIEYKKPLRFRFLSLDTDAQSSYLDAFPFVAWVSDSSITPNPSIAMGIRTWYVM